MTKRPWFRSKMKNLARSLLFLSLGLNAYLLWIFRDGHNQPVAPDAAVSSPSRPVRNKPGDLSELLATGDVTPSELISIRDRLRAAGVSDSVVRGVIEGILQRRFRERISPARIERTKTTWWRSTALASPGPPSPNEEEIKLLREMVLDPLEKLFGSDALVIAESESRYDFLPADKAIRLAAIDLDYDEMRLRLMQSRPGDARLKAELDQLRLLNIEKHKDVLAVLSPGERAEYELRFGMDGYGVRVRMEPIEGTEQEYRVAYPILKSFNEGLTAQARKPGGPGTADDITRQAVQDLMRALGSDRGLDFVWAGSMDFAAYAQAAREAGLPAGAAGRTLQLAAETGVKAWEIHSNAALSIEDKRAALLMLQQEVQSQLDNVFPAAARQRVSDQTLAWLTQLGAGSYKLFPVTLSGRNSGASYSLTMPARAKPPFVPVVSKSGR